MAQERNPLEIYKLLPQTNCGRCYLPSCLAFAAAAVKGEKKLSDCPYLDDGEAGRFVGDEAQRDPDEAKRQEKVRALQEKVRSIDLGEAADRVGGELRNGSLVVKSLGKDFAVDPHGRVSSECHTHAGLTIPLLQYVIGSSGREPSGEWVRFRDLPEGLAMNALFTRKGEQALRHLLDRHTDLLENLIDIFSGRRMVEGSSADVAVVLYPLPKMPLAIRYWKSEEDLGSEVGILFDSSAGEHLDTRSIYSLAVGLVMMFEKIAVRHGG